MDEFRDRLKRARSRRYPTARQAAEAMGINHNTYGGWEAGSRGDKRPEPDQLVRIARKFGVSLTWLAFGQGTMGNGNAVSVMGQIGAGAMIEPDADPPGGLYEVLLPQAAPPGVIAFEVTGDSWYPFMREGHIVVVYEELRRPVETLIGHHAAVRTTAGQRFYKILESPTVPRPGFFNLVSSNGAIMRDVQVEWIGQHFNDYPATEVERIELPADPLIIAPRKVRQKKVAI